MLDRVIVAYSAAITIREDLDRSWSTITAVAICLSKAVSFNGNGCLMGCPARINFAGSTAELNWRRI